MAGIFDPGIFDSGIFDTEGVPRTASDAPTTSDSANRVLNAVRAAAEGITFSDTATVNKNTARSASDNPTFSDAATQVITHGGLSQIILIM